MRVLILNHTSQVSGAERSLLDLLDGLPSGTEAVLAAPSGALMDVARGRGIRVVELPGTDVSLKLSPKATLVGGLQLLRAAFEGARLQRRIGADLVHANSIRSSLSAVLAARLTRVPVVAHIRDTLPPGRVSDLTLKLIAGGAEVVVANSRHTASAFTATTGRTNVDVVYNAIDLARFERRRYSALEQRASLGLSGSAFVITIVGQITPWKGQKEAVRIVERLKDVRPDVRLLVVGEAKFVSSSTRYDNRAYLEGIRQLVAEAKLETRVSFLGERNDIPEILAASDMLIVPSWEEPFGRVVIEGMALGLPVVATAVGGPAELISNDVDGILLAPRDVDGWASNIDELIGNPARRERLGAAAARRAQAFGVGAHGTQMSALYARVLRPSPTRN